MAFRINRAILHVIDGEGTGRLSEQQLDIDSETCFQFVGKHVKRLLRHPEAKTATFSAESAVYEWVRAYQKEELRFTELSHRLCDRLSEVIRDSDEIAPADILIVDFEDGRGRYLAMLRLGYIECFTHKLTEGDHQIVKNTNVLPFTSGKVEEACLIPYEPMVLRILEKPYRVNGETLPAFSQRFLECDTNLSKKEMADLIGQAAEEINEKYFAHDAEASARFGKALIAEADLRDDDEGLLLEDVVKRAFQQNEQAAGEFLAMTKESGLPHEVKLDAAFARRQFGTCRFKAAGGVEVKFPAELLEQGDSIRFVQGADGTVSITLNGLHRVES